MNLAQRILRLIHPKDEEQRMEMRGQIARAAAEAEDLTRTTLTMDCESLRRWLDENGKSFK